jgi:hypothetical protein
MARLLENIIKLFEKVGLALVVVTEPIRMVRGPAGKNIFQMDIERNVKGVHRHERFRIYPGHKDNVIQVRDQDLKSRQILLMVQEPEREYEDEVRIGRKTKYSDTSEGTLRKQLALQKFFGIKKLGDKLVYKGKTPSQKRYFLMGFDERQLFIAQLKTAATTIDAARKSLGRTVMMQFGDGKRRASIDRQGEWFLVETSQETRNLIEQAIKSTKAIIHTKTNIGKILGKSGGNPHTADEIVIIPDRSSTFLRKRVFVRGKIRHRDHETKKLNHWREVFMNDEGATSSGSASGVFYID